MAKLVEPETMGHADLVFLCRQLMGRNKLAFSFMKEVGIWGDYQKWIKLKNIRIGD